MTFIVMVSNMYGKGHFGKGMCTWFSVYTLCKIKGLESNDQELVESEPKSYSRNKVGNNYNYK